MPPTNKGNHAHDYSYDYRQSDMIMRYKSTITISIDHESKLNVIKSRYSPLKGDISLYEAVEIFSEMLSQAAFNGRMNMFQEGMKIQLIDTITQTIRKGV